MNRKAIIFDASAIISFGMNGMFEEFRKLKSVFEGHFLVPDAVKKEVIDRPLNTKRFKFEALRLKTLFEEGVFESPKDLGLNVEEVKKETQRLVDIANNTFRIKNRPLNILDAGEVSCLAVSKLLNKKGIDSVIATDERTIKIISERPEYLEDYLSNKLKKKVESVSENYSDFAGFKFIRSCELVFILYEKGLADSKDVEILEAMLYALKFKGCGISEDEIHEMKKIVRKKV